MLLNCSKMLKFGTYWTTRYGQYTNLRDQSLNGPKQVTNDYLVCSLTFIIHVNTNSIAMWETLPNNADWYCFKTPILQKILRIQNRFQDDFLCMFGSHTFVPQVGCARNRHPSFTAQQKLKSFLSMQVYAWTVFPLSLSGIW